MYSKTILISNSYNNTALSLVRLIDEHKFKSLFTSYCKTEFHVLAFSRDNLKRPVLKMSCFEKHCELLMQSLTESNKLNGRNLQRFSCRKIYLLT